MSVTDIAGPPAVYVAVASAPPPVELLASRSSAGGAAIRLAMTSMNAVPFVTPAVAVEDRDLDTLQIAWSIGGAELHLADRRLVICM